MKKMKWMFWLNAIFYIVLWALLLFSPKTSLETVIVVFGIESMLSWILSVVFVLQEPDLEDRSLFAWLAILQIILWISLMFFPEWWEKVLEIFVVIIGVFAMIKGLILSIDSFQAKKLWLRNWYWMLIAGVVLIVLWLFLLMNSYLTLLVVSSITWLWLLASWISMIVWALQVRKTSNAVKKEVRKNLKDWGTIEVEIVRE